MVHFKPKIQNSWGKGFLTSVMGTTISIILTFGTSALVERKVKADVQRQTAMMVIHDIDVCVDQMEEMAKEEEKRNNAVQYVLAHLDQIASMEDFYRERKEIETIISKSPVFTEPITFDEWNQMHIDSKANNYVFDYAAILKEKLKDIKVQFYIDHSPSRARFYRGYAQSWRDISDRNKFIMDISDEELAEYIKNSQRSGSSVSKRVLMGQWERRSSGNQDHYYEFLENDSFCRKTITQYAYPFYNDVILVTYIYGGKWNLKDDTLFMENSPNNVEVKLDTSRITYRPEMRDTVRRFIRNMNIMAKK